jgi:hypothetical protein
VKPMRIATLIHRSLPSRLVEGTVGPAVPPAIMTKYAASWSSPELRASEAEMRGQLAWIAQQLSLVFDEAAIL